MKDSFGRLIRVIRAAKLSDEQMAAALAEIVQLASEEPAPENNASWPTLPGDAMDLVFGHHKKPAIMRDKKRCSFGDRKPVVKGKRVCRKHLRMLRENALKARKTRENGK